MIVKNEETVLPICLASISNLFDQVVVVDTGSTDRTKEIAAEFGATVIDFDWVDSFSAARNEAIKHAKGRWIFYLDADEYLDNDNRRKLRDLFNGLNNKDVAYVLQQRSRVKDDRGSRILLDRICLFQNRPEHRWRLRVHEQIVPALGATRTALVRTDITVEHSGYEDPVKTRQKCERYLRLIELDHAERPEDPFILFNLCSTNFVLGRPGTCLPLFELARKNPRPIAHLLPQLCILEAKCLQLIGRPEDALTVIERGRIEFPGDVMLRFEEAMLHKAVGDLARSEHCLRCLLAAPHEGKDQSVAPDCPAPTWEGLTGYYGRHHLAMVLQQAGRPAEAEVEWRATLTDRPTFTPAASHLAELYLSQERWTEFDQVAAVLAADCGEPIDAAVFRARACLQRGDVDEARRIAQETVNRYADAVWPRVILTQALLRLGEEKLAEAELREVIRLDPFQIESRRNLAKLLRNQNRFAEAIACCQDGREYFPDEPDLLRVQGLCHRDMNRLVEAIPFLRRYLGSLSWNPSADTGDPAHATAVRYQLGRIYCELGIAEKAETQWQALVAEDSSFVAAWMELGNLYLNQKRWSDLAKVADQLEEGLQLTTEAAYFRARIPISQALHGTAPKRQ